MSALRADKSVAGAGFQARVMPSATPPAVAPA